MFTSIADGDLAVHGDGPALDARRRAVVDHPWTWLHQVHGADVVSVARPGDGAGSSADAAVTRVAGAVLAVHTADCAPVAFLADGVVGVAHVGWRGLARGLVAATAAAMRDLGAGDIDARIGPCIRPRCYPFGADDLEAVARIAGDEVRATTAWGTPALDLAAGITRALGRAGVSSVMDGGVCTACSPAHWSHRARGDTGRQAVAVWLDR